MIETHETVPPGALHGVKALSWIRTPGLHFTKTPPDSADGDVSRTYKIEKTNYSADDSSQAPQKIQTDPQLTDMAQTLAKLSDVERDAVAQHIKALSTMSKKRRQAILTLTEDEM